MLDQKPSTTEPQPGSLELTEELIRRRAYDFYEKRGCEDGHDFDDWLQAEGEYWERQLPIPNHSEKKRPEALSPLRQR